MVFVRALSDKMTDASLTLVAGLGNPGEKYSRTRHNIGFMVVEELARQYSLPLTSSRFDADCSKRQISLGLLFP